ncbi:MAG: GGDEF domain-containing protein [Pseudomonadota bacterium]
METGITISLDINILVGLMLCATILGAVGVKLGGQLVERLRRALDRRDAERRQSGPLADRIRAGAQAPNDAALPSISAFIPAIELQRVRSETILRAKIDHLSTVQQLWGPDARTAAIRQLSGVLRRGVRTGQASGRAACDEVTTLAGDGFSILIRDSDESEARSIAQRLRRELARARIDGVSDNIHLTASFGVAERRPGESYGAWRARADGALRKAQARGQGQIVEARIADEVILLPPPEQSSDVPVASAA